MSKYICPAKLDKKMQSYAAKLEFEEAAKLRDEINRLKAKQVGIPNKLLGFKSSYSKLFGLGETFLLFR